MQKQMVQRPDMTEMTQAIRLATMKSLIMLIRGMHWSEMRGSRDNPTDYSSVKEVCEGQELG